MEDRVGCDWVSEPYKAHANFRDNLRRGLKLIKKRLKS